MTLDVYLYCRYNRILKSKIQIYKTLLQDQTTPELIPFQELNGSLRDLRIADLDLFITASHLKNLGQAAALHHLSQSAASAAIQRVEKAFGRPLCTHERRQFRLTKEGQLLLPKAENWLRHVKRGCSNSRATTDPSCDNTRNCKSERSCCFAD